MKCPSGHSIPHRTKRGECTPMYCAQVDAPTRTEKTTKRKKENKRGKQDFASRREAAIIKATKDVEAAVLRTPIPIPDGASETLASEGRLEALTQGSLGAGRHHARLSFIKGMPDENADEKAINDWTDTRFNKLLPIAVAEKEYQLRFGDDKQRAEAADTVLRATGRAQKDGFIGGGASIILNIGSTGMQLPYMPKHMKTVDGSATHEQVIDGKVALPEGVPNAKK